VRLLHGRENIVPPILRHPRDFSRRGALQFQADVLEAVSKIAMSSAIEGFERKNAEFAAV
jgi:hypothetical protein